MDAVTQVTKPRGCSFAVEVLNAGVVVVGGGDGAGYRDPVLRRAVLEGDLSCLVLLDVREFTGMFVG